jgi:hypothetical protein
MAKKILLSFAIVLLFGTATANAQTTMTAADILPASTGMMIDIHTDATDPISGFIEDLLNEGFAEDEVFQNMQNIISNTVITFAIEGTTPTEEKFYAIMETTQTEFDDLISLSSEELTEETYSGTTIYSDGVDHFTAYTGGFLVMTSTVENLHECIDRAKGIRSDDLNSNSFYSQTRAQKAGNEVMFIFIGGEYLSEYSDAFTDMDLQLTPFSMTGNEEEILSAINAEGFSIGYSNSSYIIKMVVLGDSAKLTSLDLNFDRYNFTPNLYKSVTGQDIIFYAERYNLGDTLDISMDMVMPELQTEFEAFKEDLKTETDIDFDTEILELINERVLFAVHNTGEIIPGITAIAEVNGKTATAANLVSKLVTAIKDSLDEESTLAGEDVYTYQKETINYIIFDSFTIDLWKMDPDVPEGTQLKLMLAVANNRIIFTTHKNFGEIYGTSTNGILDNPQVSAFWDNPSMEIAEVAYFSMPETSEWIETMLESDPSLTPVIDVLSVFGDIFSISTATAGSMTGEITIEINETQLAASLDNFVEQLKAISESYEPQYCDVSGADWYFSPVTTLTYLGIVKGYEDGCFHPEKEITRAEFTKMVLMAYEMTEGAILTPDYGVEIFSDVTPDAWYEFYVEAAAENNLVNGYGDGTFGPNNTITRAEAVQILYNASEIIQSATVPSNPFTDFSIEEWFSTAVLKNYSVGIVNGISPTTFAPHKNLNRAEAAKLVYEYLNLQ